MLFTFSLSDNKTVKAPTIVGTQNKNETDITENRAPPCFNSEKESQYNSIKYRNSYYN